MKPLLIKVGSRWACIRRHADGDRDYSRWGWGETPQIAYSILVAMVVHG